MVTVDAGHRRVFEGRVEPLLSSAPAAGAGPASGPGDTLLECVASYVVPLSLTDPRDPSFTPLNCTTLHDLARYVHERSFEEMFSIHALVGDVRRQAPVLDVFLPVDLYVLDLGGGLDAPPGARRVKRGQIASPLLKSLIDGMLHRDIPRSGPRAMDAGGFFQVVMRHGLTNPEDNAGLRDPSFAIVSDRYLNVASRVGYHFSAVDAYCGDFVNENYITFRFKGGAADRIRRERRVRAIGRILKAMGFAVTVTDDLVVANFQKQPGEAVLAHLEMLGRLLQFMRQMDAAMASDAWVDRVVQAFLDGDYGMAGDAGNGR